ncbi:unnamed protein product [Sphenostylis stenocarpa]|uniref:Uncharacterized protein n=1 Tax=Sphenostylis stenocarpa TaxID=92480 RepID=A0AA86T2H6_9FABA|nr:unnamed protein product [Sphenostylis stenocarpa]
MAQIMQGQAAWGFSGVCVTYIGATCLWEVPLSFDKWRMGIAVAGKITFPGEGRSKRLRLANGKGIPRNRLSHE